MASFLSRYYDEIDENLNDPSISVRITNADKLRLLKNIERQVWERLLTASGQESMIGLTEVDISVVADTDTYLLPGNFRQFVRFERRTTTTDRSTTEELLPSVPYYSDQPGVVILSGFRGLRIRPMPQSAATWTLVYKKGPVNPLDGDIAAGPSSTSFVVDVVNNGELISEDDYYNGSLVRLYDDGGGVGTQIRQVSDYVGSTNTFTVDTAFSPAPAENDKIEIVPSLPEGLDSIYALDAAIRILGRRGKKQHRRDLIEERAELWVACKNYFLSNVADRGPSRVIPVKADMPDDGYNEWTELF